MAALSKATAVPVPTIKFYLREGLLPPGVRTSPNQSQYDDTHVHRLGLIRGMTELGGLSLATVAEVLSAIDDPALSLHSVFGIVQRAVTHQILPAGQDQDEQAELQLVDDIMTRHGWTLAENDTHRRTAAALLSNLAAIDVNHSPEAIDGYATAAGQIAALDLASLSVSENRDRMIETVATATILGDALLATFRRMAQTALSAERFGGAGEPHSEGAESDQA